MTAVISAALRRTEAPDVLFFTSSRAMPARDTSFAGHALLDPRAPFHWWFDINGERKPEQVRDLEDVVVPDGVGLGATLIAHRLEIVCVSGWYGAGMFCVPGLPSLTDGLKKRLHAFVQEHADRTLLGAWDFGSPLAGDALEREVRGLRGEAPVEGPSNRYLIGPSPKDSQTLRELLQSVTRNFYEKGPNEGSWGHTDQTELLRYQAKRGLPVSGWADLMTVAALREDCERQRTTSQGTQNERTSNPSLVAGPRFGPSPSATHPVR